MSCHGCLGLSFSFFQSRIFESILFEENISWSTNITRRKVLKVAKGLAKVEKMNDERTLDDS